MSEITKQTSEIANELTVDRIKEFVDKPLRQLPVEWRPVVWDFWSGWSHLLPTQLSLCSQLRHWIADHGLTLDDAREAFRTANNPEAMARMKFASDLLSHLADIVAIQGRARKRREEEKRRREQDEREKSEALSGKEIQALMSGIGKGGS